MIFGESGNDTIISYYYSIYLKNALEKNGRAKSSFSEALGCASFLQVTLEMLVNFEKIPAKRRNVFIVNYHPGFLISTCCLYFKLSHQFGTQQATFECKKVVTTTVGIPIFDLSL